MKILYTVTSAGFGGASLHVLQLMEHMVGQGHEVGLVAAPDPILTELARGLGVHIFPNPHFVRPLRPWKDFQALLFVFHAIRKFDPDIVSAHSTKAGLAARLACALLHKPAIFTAHGWAFTEGKSLWIRHFLALIERLAAKVTRKFICVSEYDKRLALLYHVSSLAKLKVIHNGMPPDLYLKDSGERVRKELQLSNDEVLITMVARFVPQKDHNTLLRAIQSVNGKYRLALVGGGELEHRFRERVRKQRVSEKVIVLGERRDIPEILRASDIFVLSTNWEGLPRSVIEAMMAGLPVVATHVGGVPELVEDGVTGFLVPPKDPQALAEALRKLIDDPELRKRMGQAGREKALREFTLDRMLRETERVYQEVLGKE